VRTLRRIAPGLVLLVLAPLIAEFLLGDFSVRRLGLLIAFIPQYGGGALLVREIARRARRGWPTIMLLALAYALVQEGFTTQTLFNPNYAGQRLLDYGYIPALGTSLDWTVFVLTLHVIWSIGSCIAIAEPLAGERWAEPWLGRAGLAIISLLFLAGSTFTILITKKTFPYVASPAQFATVAIAVIVAIVAAFRIPRTRRPSVTARAPSLWLTGTATLLLSSAFYVLRLRGQLYGLHPAVTVLGMLALELVAIACLTAWSRRAGWGPLHALAAATGAILTYGWLSIARMIAGRTALGAPTTAIDVAGQIVLLLAILAVARTGVHRLHRWNAQLST
jgi:hypothetical protein